MGFRSRPRPWTLLPMGMVTGVAMGVKREGSVVGGGVAGVAVAAAARARVERVLAKARRGGPTRAPRACPRPTRAEARRVARVRRAGAMGVVPKRGQNRAGTQGPSRGRCGGQSGRQSAEVRHLGSPRWRAGCHGPGPMAVAAEADGMRVGAGVMAVAMAVETAGQRPIGRPRCPSPSRSSPSRSGPMRDRVGRMRGRMRSLRPRRGRPTRRHPSRGRCTGTSSGS